jgi:argininosuccinate synthase
MLELLRGVLTRRSNDQVRFELAFAACNPSLKVIAPWRMPEFIAKFQFVLSFKRLCEYRILTMIIGVVRIS